MKLEGKSLKRDFIRFIIPSITAQWVFALYQLVDGIFVARGVSETALTAVNISLPFVAGMFSISILLAIGNSTIVAIKLGQGKTQDANEIFTQNVFLSIFVSLLISMTVLLNLESFARFLGATDNILPYAIEYLGTITPFAFAYILSYSFETLIKTDGYPKLATLIVTIGAVLNIILDYLFVFVFPWGVKGAAFATGLSQTIIIVLYLIHFMGKRATIRFARFKLQPRIIVRQLKNGLSSGITEFSSGIIIFIFNHAILTHLYEEALVSYTIVSYVNTLVTMTFIGIAQGVQPLMSYYVGKREPEKHKKLLKYSLITGISTSFLCTIGCFLFADGIVSLFLENMNSELASYSVRVFRIFILSFLFTGFNIVIGGYFTAIEKSRTATTLSLTRGIIALIGTLFVLTTLIGGEGIWWTPFLSECICMFLTILFFHKNKMRHAF